MPTGKVSHFGGKADKMDRENHLAHIRLRKSPLDTIRFHQNTSLKNLFIPLLDASLLYRNNPQFGLSAALNTNFPYYADRSTEKPKLYDTENPIMVFTYNNKSALALRIDYGPHPTTGRLFDLSPGLLRFLGADTDSVVTARPATTAEKIAFWSGKFRRQEDIDIIIPLLFLSSLAILALKGLKK